VVLNITQFSVDISVLDTGKYRKLVITGGICGSCSGSPGLGRMYVIGLEIVYLLMYLWTRTSMIRFRTKRCNGTPLTVLGPYRTCEGETNKWCPNILYNCSVQLSFGPIEKANARAGSPPTDGGGLTISGYLKSFEGPVLKCRGSREYRALYLNELVIHEIRNNASAIFQNFLSSVVK
jgi:hypothetical protein